MQTRHDLIEQFIQLRRKRGLTQERLEELSGVSQQQISRIERVLADPRIDSLLALAATLRARLVLVPDENADTRPLPMNVLDESHLSERTGVEDLIVRDEEGKEE